MQSGVTSHRLVTESDFPIGMSKTRMGGGGGRGEQGQGIGPLPQNPPHLLGQDTSRTHGGLETAQLGSLAGPQIQCKTTAIIMMPHRNNSTRPAITVHMALY